MIAQIGHFLDEVDELSGLLAAISPNQWMVHTQFKQWTVNDVILHLYASDNLALASVRGEAEYRSLRAEVMTRRANGLSMIEESRRRFPLMRGEALRKAWVEQANALCDLLARRDPESRLPWSGPDMGVKMFASARQMETWAHGQEIFDIFGEERNATQRIRNIAVLGVKTFGWSFKNRELPIPEHVPNVCLQSPEGEVWEWLSGAPVEEEIQGPAVAFCQVVTQVRNIADVTLKVSGNTARRWMDIAQCFAGPPSDPPLPGTRFKVPQMAVLQ